MSDKFSGVNPVVLDLHKVVFSDSTLRLVKLILLEYILSLYKDDLTDSTNSLISYVLFVRTYVTRFAKTRHNDAFLEIQIFTSMSFMYLKLYSVTISMLYC